MFMKAAVKIVFALLLIYPAITWASPADYKELAIPQFGKLLLPNDVNVGPISNIADYLTEDYLNQYKGNLSPEQLENLKQAKLEFKDIDAGCYQLTTNDGTSYRQAWIVALHIKQPASKLEAFFQGPPTVDKKTTALLSTADLQSQINSFTYEDKKNLLTFKLNEISLPNLFAYNNQTLVTMQVRALFKIQDFMFPLTVRGYATAPDNKLTVLLMLVQDSEKTYWEELMREAILRSTNSEE